jgi:hypothetical protein
MDSKKYIGIDVHKESISIAAMNDAGKIGMECVIETKASMILRFIDGLCGDLQVTFEEGTSAAWAQHCVLNCVTLPGVRNRHTMSKCSTVAGQLQQHDDVLKSFTVTPKANELVTRGLYSRLQHPMYVFVDLTVSGIALAAHRWSVLLLLVILLPLQMRNARRERNVLQDKFGERYELYRRATWF